MAQIPGQQFFVPWEAAPEFSEAPHDQTLEQRISKLAEFAIKNGPAFVGMIRQKQQNNPEYAFLSGGSGADYFRWKLYTFLYKLDPGQPLQLAAGQLAPHQAQPTTSSGDATSRDPVAPQDPLAALEHAAGQLPPEVGADFAQLLSKLNGTRSSIKDSKEWFMAHIQFAEGLAARMALHQRQLPAYEQHLHLIYLANDVLLKSQLQREEGSSPVVGPVARAFLAALPIMLNSAFQAGNTSPEAEQRLTTILHHWGGRGVYPEECIAELTRAMTDGPLPAQQPPSHAAPAQFAGPGAVGGAPPPQPWSQPTSAQPWQQQLQPQGPPPGIPAQHAVQGGFRPPQEPYWPHQPPAQIPAVPGPWNSGALQAPNFQPPERQGFGPPTPQPGFGLGGQPGFGHVLQAPGFAGMPPPGHPQLGPGFAAAHPPPVLPAWDVPPPSQHTFPQPVAPEMPPQVAAAGPPPQQEESLNPMSFPPGLIPSLVEENLRTEDTYAPLSKRDVERVGIPKANEPDSYLLARLERMYAELQDYRPGTSKADLEDDQRRQRTRTALGGSNPRVLASAAGDAPSDGSFKGGRREGGPAGLGFSNAATEEVDPSDPFSQYRRQRSGFYHEAIVRATATANEPQPVR